MSKISDTGIEEQQKAGGMTNKSMVERLAKKSIAHVPPNRMTASDKARWWLNAIADEILDAPLCTDYILEEVYGWLRSQAKGGTDGD